MCVSGLRRGTPHMNKLRAWLSSTPTPRCAE